MKATKFYSRVFPPKRFPYETFLPMLPLVSVYSMFFPLLQHFSSPFILFDSSRHLSKRGGDNHKLERQSRDFYEITTIFFVRFPFGEQKLLNESLFIISIEISRIFWLGLILRQSRLCVKNTRPHKRQPRTHKKNAQNKMCCGIITIGYAMGDRKEERN